MTATAWGLRLAGAGCLALVVLMLIYGAPWAHIIYAESPYRYLLGGLALLAAAPVVRHGAGIDRAAWKRQIGRVVLVAVSLAVAFVGSELVLRQLLIGRQNANSMQRLRTMNRTRQKQAIRSDHPLALIIEPSDDDQVVYELQPDLDLDFGHTRVRTNHEGMRESTDYPHAKPPGTLRIVGVGDSGMFGWNVEQDGEYMALLEQHLNQRTNGVRYDVLNLAVPGYNSSLEVARLRHRGLPYQPDVVVVGWCENDGQLPFFLLEKENFHRRDISFLNLLLFHREKFQRIAAGSHVEDLRTYDKSQVSTDILEGTQRAGLEKAFRAFKQLSETHRFHLLMFGPMGQGVRELADQVGITYYNTYEKVDKTKYPPEWEVHFMHPSPEGHGVLAQHLEAELDRLGWLTLRPAATNAPVAPSSTP